jgi:isopentenyl phosphate kinase
MYLCILYIVEVDIEGQNRIVISGGGFFGHYIVKQFHFHWGTVDRRGCEHDINGRRFPMEVNMILDIQCITVSGTTASGTVRPIKYDLTINQIDHNGKINDLVFRVLRF